MVELVVEIDAVLETDVTVMLSISADGDTAQG